MKKFLSAVGGLFLVLILAMGAFIGYAAYQGQGLDASSKTYIKDNVPPILASWSKDELVKRLAPQVAEKISEDQLDLLFRKFSKLGSLKEFGEPKGDSTISYTSEHGKVITASYVVNAKFEFGEARISIRLAQTSGQWRIAGFNVNSPFFLQEHGEAGVV